MLLRLAHNMFFALIVVCLATDCFMLKKRFTSFALGINESASIFASKVVYEN